MSKDAYYFPHDSNARHDPKMIAMMAVYGAQGYGWYWMIIEILREQKDYKYPIDNKYAYNVIAKELGADIEKAIEFLNDCKSEFGLLVEDDNFLWSEALIDRMRPLDARRKQAKAAADARWGNGKKKKVRDSSRGEDETNIEPKKLDPKKVKALAVLQNDEYFQHLSVDIAEKLQIRPEIIERERHRCLDWMKSKGRAFKDYRAFFRNWMRTVKENQTTERPSNGMVF